MTLTVQAMAKGIKMEKTRRKKSSCLKLDQLLILIALVSMCMNVLLICRHDDEMKQQGPDTSKTGEGIFTGNMPLDVANNQPSIINDSVNKAANDSNLAGDTCSSHSDRIHIVVVSDREQSDFPLKGLINSILNFTSIPVTVNVVTSKDNIPFLDNLNTTSYFTTKYHNSTTTLQLSQQLMRESGFKTLHYSAKYGMQKLFLNNLRLPPETRKFLVLDDDITFFTDIAPLWQTIMSSPHKISLYCPEDVNRVNHYFTNKRAPDNGHSTRYCNSGMFALPVRSNFTQLAIEATHKMVNQYDFSYSVADQDIVNRMLAENNSDYEFIPCNWACDCNSWYVCVTFQHGFSVILFFSFFNSILQ